MREAAWAVEGVLRRSSTHVSFEKVLRYSTIEDLYSTYAEELDPTEFLELGVKLEEMSTRERGT